MSNSYRTAAANAKSYIAATSIVTGNVVTSVLICDDRPDFRDCLESMLEPQQSGIRVRGVPDGFGLLDAYAAEPADLTLIGIHAGDTGQQAIDLHLAMHPTAWIIVIGSITDLALLEEGYFRGATGLLLWDHD